MDIHLQETLKEINIYIKLSLNTEAPSSWADLGGDVVTWVAWSMQREREKRGSISIWGVSISEGSLDFGGLCREKDANGEQEKKLRNVEREKKWRKRERVTEEEKEKWSNGEENLENRDLSSQYTLSFQYTNTLRN